MKKTGFGERIKNFFGLGRSNQDGFFEDLADLLVEGDFGAAEAFRTVEALEEDCKKNKITDPGEIRGRLAVLLEAMLPGAVREEESRVMLLLGVNGVGKTTSAAKLAAYYASRGRRPILAAADTFRAAAADQLKIHGERLSVRVVAHKQGGDPAAVIYDALDAARAGGGDLIIADTAGRMHTKSALVEELRKIDRVVVSRSGEEGYRKYLVLDSTTGRNALAQAEIFHDALSLDGVILTKYDSSARGGIAFSLSGSLGLPVVWICDGEGYGDLHPFNPHEYAREFTGLE
ncbi:MAG: signal recognition particle-docking protein FtsY [Spirochaetaceae bacterium]|jgi:fused signal recognition particle receptor|nr:signal recognition particle-docking protein FtsY [Spirochaetaceae bacterium]